MSGSVENTLWCKSFVDELARAGLVEVVIAPGSRSTPLVMAFASDGRFRTRVHLDERSASFFALGVGKATGRPAAIVTTSGTAVANVFPAVVEAAQSGVPLLVLTADRPHRLRDADANQAIDQIGIYGRYTRAFFEAAPPTTDDTALRHLRMLAARAYAAACGSAAGPVHVNFPFDKPLEPVPVSVPASLADEHPVAAQGRPRDQPYTRIDTGATLPDEEVLAEVAGLLTWPGGVIVVGPSEAAEDVGPASLRLGAATGYPVLSDPIGGARFGDPSGASVVAGYDLFLSDQEIRGLLKPALVVRVGASPTSAALQQWMWQHRDVPHLVIDDGPRWKDHGATATWYLRTDPASTLEALCGRMEGMERGADEDAVAAAWMAASEAARTSLAVESGGESHEGAVVGAIASVLPSGTSLVVSSSMPIRDVDAFAMPRSDAIRVVANRGASGIDGVVSTAFGVASQSEAGTVCILGDVAFFHDQNGLLWRREKDAAVVFVVVDNDGGGIFHMLPIADHDPDFTRFFATPHGLSPEHPAAMHSIAYAEAEASDVSDAVLQALEAGESAVIRVRSDRARSHARRAEVREAVCAAVRVALSASPGGTS